MVAVASNLFVNWTGVSFTPNGGSAINILEVLDVQIMRGGKLISFFGDARRFARGKKMVENERGLKITTGNVAVMAAVEEGTVGTLVATLNDMNNGTGTGAITFTLTNAVLKSNPYHGSNNAFAAGVLDFECFGDSADDDPLSFVIAP